MVEPNHEKKKTLKDYLLIPGGESTSPTFESYRLRGVYLSSIALVALVEVAERLSRDQLALMLRVTKVHLQEHGIELPVVAVAYPKGPEARGAELAQLGSDQEWHRGEFLVYVRETQQSAESLAEEILVASPPDVAVIAYTPMSVRQVVEGWSEATGMLRELSQRQKVDERFSDEDLRRAAHELLQELSVPLLETAEAAINGRLL